MFNSQENQWGEQRGGKPMEMYQWKVAFLETSGGAKANTNHKTDFVDKLKAPKTGSFASEQ